MISNYSDSYKGYNSEEQTYVPCWQDLNLKCAMDGLIFVN